MALRACGVLLAACSKNNEDTAKLGFSHPDSVLKLEHFSAFKANWNPKDENILAIAHELSLWLASRALSLSMTTQLSEPGSRRNFQRSQFQMLAMT